MAKKPQVKKKPLPAPVKDTFDDTDWIKAKWRPMMAWQYIATCTCDFIIFPIAYAAAQAIFDGRVAEQWHPITLEGAGFYHVAMGAVLGISAYTRGRERMVAMETYDFNDLDHDNIPDDEEAHGAIADSSDNLEEDIPRPPRNNRKSSRRAD